MTPDTAPGSDPGATSPTTGETLRTIRQNLTGVLTEMALACRRAGRRLADVKLLPVTKYVGPELARSLHTAGLHDLGESTVQETLRKQAALPGVLVRWHLVGHLQRNKVGKALELYSVIHSLDSFGLAEVIDRRTRQNPAAVPELFVEVNIAGESAKSGLAPADTLEFLGRIHDETALGESLAGLMTVVPLVVDPEDTRQYFRHLRELRDTAVQAGLLSESAGLSMGMSNDFTIAIEEGASIVRVGSRLFEGLPQRKKN